MEEKIVSVFKSEGIDSDSLGAIAFDNCKIINERKLSKLQFNPKSAIMFCVPYRSGEFANRNISLYAIPKDYHIFFSTIGNNICQNLKNEYPNNSFECFADSSIIDERDAFRKAGLGIIGDNGLVFTKRYGSYVFLGEIICDMELSSIGEKSFVDLSPSFGCIHCNKCKDFCPAVKNNSDCISAITQKKGELSESEEKLVFEGLVWGCDICQEICPLNQNREYSNIPFFKTDLITNLSESVIDNMSREEIALRAWSWRGVDVVKRNIKIKGKTD